jgi:hypothetical protein
MYLGSPKGRVIKNDWFDSNNVDTPSNKQTGFGNKRNLFKKQMHSGQMKNFGSGLNSKIKHSKKKLKPQSTKHMNLKGNFTKGSLNRSQAEQQWDLGESRFSGHQYSIQNSSVQLDMHLKQKGFKKTGLGFGKSKASKLKKSKVLFLDKKRISFNGF